MGIPERKICIIGPSIKMGGVERAGSTLANSLISMKIAVTYIAIFKQQQFFKLSEGIKFYEPDNFNINRLSFYKTLRYIRSIVNSENPDSVFVYTKFYSALVLFALFNTKHKVFISERSSPTYKWPLKIRIINWILFKVNPPDGIVAQTKLAAEYQKRYFGMKIPIKIIPNALKEIKLFPNVQKQQIVLAVGRFNDRTKGFDRLIKAFSKVEVPGWKLTFAGGDENGESLKEQSRELGILDKVEFLGAVTDIDKIYAQASIFVIPSRSEGFPNTLCEAMAAGLPCISFDFVTGPRDIITDGIDGYIVEDGSINILAQKIIYLIQNKQERERLGVNATKIRNRFNSKRIGKEYLDFILPK